MNKFKIILEGDGSRRQVLTEKDENIRAIIDAWLYMYEQANAAQQITASDGLESSAKKSVFTAEVFRPAKKRKSTRRA